MKKSSVLAVLLSAVFCFSPLAALAQKFVTSEDVIMMELRMDQDKKNRLTQKHTTLSDSYRSELFNRFIAYTQLDSQSKEDDSVEFPMNDNLRRTAAVLYEEVKTFGFKSYLSKDQYIYIHIPSNLKYDAPVLGLSAHYDTTPEIEGFGIKAQIHKNYDGKDIVINKEKALIINPQNNPHLAKCVGKTVVTSDGNTMLSGDDKAGVAIVMTLAKTLADNPNIKHGPIQIVITPNEDIGMSADRLDLKYYKPDFAFDFDGGVDGEIIAENFSAELYKIAFKGRAAHPSVAKEHDMLDPNEIGSGFVASLPAKLWPQHSEKKEPYLHVYDMEKRGDQMIVSARSRYFDRNDGAAIDSIVHHKADSVAQAFRTQVEIHRSKQYENVKYGVNPKAAELVTKAAKDAGVTPRLIAERAGTTTAMMMAKWGFGGYTIFTGQVNPHAYTEWLSEQDMFDAYRTGLNLVKEVAQLKTEKKK